MTVSEIRSKFHEDLGRLERLAIEGIDLVVDQVDRTTETLRHHDVELAQLVVMADQRIDARYLDLHSGVISLLALQAPVARDLRLVTSLLYIARHLERMGDQCVNIAKLIPISGQDAPRQDEVVCRLVEMGRLVRSEVVQARQAFELRDVELARSVVDTDRQVNLLNREIFRFAIDLGDDHDVREWLLTMAMVARSFERIGDNAVDVGELVTFVVEGLFQEFGDAGRGSR